MIASGDIKLLKSQVLLDTSDGGGAMTALEVIDGVSNNLFPDVSELDRTYGRIAMRKAFPAVQTNTNDSYYGSQVIVSKVPADPRVSVSLFTTKSWVDRRAQARDKVERYLARGPKWPGHLLETQLEGQRAIQIAERPQDAEPKVGQGLTLVQNEGLPTEYEQYVRVTKVSAEERTFTVQNQKEVVRKVLTVEISDPLRFNFVGASVHDFEALPTSPAYCRDTRVADAATYFGASRLSAPAALNDASLTVDSIYTQLVPSAQSETPLVDLNASSLSSLYVPGNTGSISTSINAPVGPSTRLYIGSSIVPGTLSLTVNGNGLVDAGGVVKNGSTEVGVVDYAKGLITFNLAMFSFSGSMALSFTPAAVPTRVNDTASISIVQDTRGYNYTITLLPIPSPGSLSVSYMAQGKVYYLYDYGNGVLKGSDSAFGAGSINYTTGSVIITTGALPDAGSDIIFAWGKKTSTFTRSDMAVAPAKLEIQLANPQTAPGTVTITWSVGVTPKTATDDGNGNITGDAVGKINYATSLIKLTPTQLYQQGTEFTVVSQWGAPNEQRFDMPGRDVNGNVSVTLPNLGGAVIPKTVQLEWNVDIADSELLGTIFTEQTWDPPPPPVMRDPLVYATDDGSGGFKLADGTTQPGSILDYATRVLVLAPDRNVKIPKPVWANQPIGQQRQDVFQNGGSGVSVVTTYRRVISSWILVDTIATMPIDEAGHLTVKWRTSAGATASTETFTAGALKFDLTPGFAEDILQGSVRFTLGAYTYIDRLGSLYHSVSPVNGSGTVAGSITYQTGAIELTSWQPSAANAVALQSLVTEMNAQAVDEVVFRVPITPVRSGSIQIRCVPIEGNAGAPVNVTADGTGRISSPYMIGTVDYQSGVVRIRFGQKLTVDATVQAQPWYVADAVFTEGGVAKIVKPRPVYADSIRYNAVGYTYLPLRADILGMDPVRLPSDGRVPIFRVGEVAVVHHTDDAVFSGTPAANTSLYVGRVRVSYIKVYDANGIALDPTMYTNDLDAGVVTLGATYSLGVLTPPLRAEHRIEDMAVITDLQINGRMALNIPLTHVFPMESTLVSSALIMGDLQARVFGEFSQESWTNVWSDSLIGSNTTSQFNDTLYPITTKNVGAAEERWALIFTNSTSFRVVGENAGQIATGDINTDLSPLNPASGLPYFVLNKLGWGVGWSAGNVLRFNTAAANYPVWLVRTVLQGPSSALSDSFQVQIRGDIDRV